MGLLGDKRKAGELRTQPGVRVEIVEGVEHLEEELAVMRAELRLEERWDKVVGALSIIPLGPVARRDQPLLTDANGQPRVSMGFLVVMVAE